MGAYTLSIAAMAVAAHGFVQAPECGRRCAGFWLCVVVLPVNLMANESPDIPRATFNH